MEPIFNYYRPVHHPERVTIQPAFPRTGARPLNSRVTVAKNSEIPLRLREAGHLTAEEDEEIMYYHCSDKRVDLGWPGEEVPEMKHYSELEIQSQLPRTMEDMLELRKLLLKRRKGDESGRSEFEGLMGATGAYEFDFSSDEEGPEAKRAKVKKTQSKALPKSGALNKRTYMLGFTVQPQQTNAGMKVISPALLKKPALAARVVQLTARIGVALLEDFVPPDILQLLNDEADIRAPLTYGGKENKYFTTAQYNFSDVDGLDLEIQLGEVGGLHCDGRDDCRRWTVLLALDNIPDGHWPGRTMITSLRVYSIMAPLTAIIFRAVHPHLSLPPAPMGESKRAPYISPVPGLAHLDPKKYHYARLKVVEYGKEWLHNNSPGLLRQHDPKQLQLPRENDIINASRSPESLPEAIAAFGTREHQFNSLARIQAVMVAHQCRRNPAKVLPSARAIAHLHQWMEDGVVMTPDIDAIQKVLSGNTFGPHNDEHEKKLEAYSRGCRERLSQNWFPSTRGSGQWNAKIGPVGWVEADALGSSFQGLKLGETSEVVIPARLNTRKAVQAEYGPKPYKCPECEKRFEIHLRVQSHLERVHPHVERGPVEPSIDPDREAKREYSDSVGDRDDDLGGDDGDKQTDFKDWVGENDQIIPMKRKRADGAHSRSSGRFPPGSLNKIPATLSH